MSFLASVLILASLPHRTPLDFARDEIAKAGIDARRIEISVRPNGTKESYSIEPHADKVRVVGSDATGAMYGAFELVERIHQSGDAAWKTAVSGSPYLPDRGLNLFLTLPWNYKKNDTDYELGALTDPNRWWFQNEDYWKTLLDLMAKSRLNWLDIHGGWDISVTNAPNLYAYFVTSKSFPKVGVPQTVKDQDMAQLNHVIEMAHSRGIRVSLMAYEANLKIPQNPNPGYEASEANIYKYTKEVVEQMIRKAPGLDAIGYRIGESGRSESFFKCYNEAVKASGRDIPVITRSWITKKQNVLPLARSSKDFTVEIKYNGEQWGAPYMVAGGRMANWGSYSYEDYLSDSGKGGQKTWKGWPTEQGGAWPSEPYKIVWQVRANGTHRIFPFYNPEWVRRTIKTMKIGTASGYTIEGEDAYYPKSPEYYSANPKGVLFNWIHQRDEMYWMTWGRLGYDPTVPEATFDSYARTLLGDTSPELLDLWKHASLVVPKAFMTYALGPDHRDHAPELEWGGDTPAFINGAGFDTFSFQPVSEHFANLLTQGLDARLYQPFDKFISGEPSQRTLLVGSRQSWNLLDTIRFEEALGEYYAGRELLADHVAGNQNGNGQKTESVINRTLQSYNILSDSFSTYRPFTERLRMHTNDFKWSDQFKLLEAEMKRLRESNMGAGTNVAAAVLERPQVGHLTWHEDGNRIVCSLTGAGDQSYLLIKPLPSSTFWHRVPMRKVGDHAEFTFSREKFGYEIAAESYIREVGSRTPDVRTETPYLVIPAEPGPTPEIYNANEALTYLDPKVITPDKYGAILVGTRAQGFFHSFNRTARRKLLEPVSKGVPMVILQQDFTKSPLDFLPKPLNIVNQASDTFTCGSVLGLVDAAVPGIMYQKFAPSDGWEILGNGGLAHMLYGKGEIWVTTARLMQSMTTEAGAKDFVALLSQGGKSKPTVLVDSGSEGSVFTSSCHPDLMNSHDIPFMTLGEVIAKEQGMNSFTPISGPTMADDVLGGKGKDIANAFVRTQVVKMAKQPTASSVDSFEKLRRNRKAELLKSLGLDPMPQKTPLNARITGTIHREGYTIEKLVFESRPNFFVTGHVYKADNAVGKLPIVVNVNGHWAHKKDEDRIQLRCAFQALQGYIAIAIDSPGWSFEGNSLIERRDEGAHNDFALVEGGTNTTGYYVWDAIRALDYMATRNDADMAHIGITGASGGGLATLYTFAADDRYSAAVPVVYMASMELAPDNGCLCNHVPATAQIGDRSDVIGIQAPKPVYIMGAQNDGEFPPDATRLTVTKMKASWKLFGRDGDVYGQIFGGGHDYNQLMREASIGFFNKYLKSQGDGSPVAQPPLTAIDADDHQLLALNPPATGEETMRNLSLEYLRAAPSGASVSQYTAINGGLPKAAPLNLKRPTDSSFTFESEPGLVTPGLVSGAVDKGTVTIVVDDAGKAVALKRESSHGGAVVYLDILGTGELSDFELRYPIYQGRSVAFTGGWQIVRAIRALGLESKRVRLVGRGALSSQAVMAAGLMDPQIASVQGLECLSEWADVFKAGVSVYAIQPRAHLCGSLANLRKLVKRGTWSTS